MGDNLPELGERACLFCRDGTIAFGVIVRVVFWDVVDLELDGGARITGVRRVLADHFHGSTEVLDTERCRFALLRPNENRNDD